MFNKKTNNTKSNKIKTDSHDRLNRLVSGTKLTGDLTTASSLRIDGEVIGNIHCTGRFVLGQEGKIKGNIIAIDVELNGIVEGQIHTEELLILHKTAKVKGDIFTERLVIEDGAEIDGIIQTGKFPISQSKVSGGSKSNKKEALEMAINEK